MSQRKHTKIFAFFFVIVVLFLSALWLWSTQKSAHVQKYNGELATQSTTQPTPMQKKANLPTPYNDSINNPRQKLSTNTIVNSSNTAKSIPPDRTTHNKDNTMRFPYVHESIPLWEAPQSSQLLTHTDSTNTSLWLPNAKVIGEVTLNNAIFDRLAIGTTLQLPTSPPIHFTIIEQHPIAHTKAMIWDTQILDDTGVPTQEFGVLTESPDIFLVTLHTKTGVFYLHSLDKKHAEIAYIEHTTQSLQ